ncbi:ankyrin repeat domain-containing protein [Winogradskyella poriferorum]|uniref:ankyrin repeat domain-containing protein n=1 Tax=Winogradskyella poriferorum TaxID=307627 RepID=UPI003D65A692
MKIVKQLIVTCTLLFGSLLFAQNNVFLNRDFWGTKPNVKTIEAKIKAGNNPSEANRNNFDGVVYAILQDAPTKSIIYLMSQKGNDVNKLTHDGRTYIFWAAYKGNTEIIKHLLDNGARTDLTDDKGNTIITFAAGSGQQNTAVYDLIITADKNQVSKTNPDGANALLLVAPYDSDLEVVTYFESKGLSIKSTDADGNGIFNYVARTGNTDLMNKLIKKGLKGTDQAFIFAAYGTRGKANTIATYEYLVAAGLNPNVADKEGLTPLHVLAARSKDIKVITYLIKKGLDVNAKDSEGNTPFTNAASRNNLSIVELLFQDVTDVNQGNNKGATALALAVKYNNADVVGFLANNKANFKFKDKEGNNLTYYLFEGYSPRNEEQFFKKLEVLKENGVDITTTQENGNTLYHLATEKQSLKLLELAAKQDININAKNNDGNTALHIAAMKAKDDKILKFLIAQGADVKATTEFDESVYDLASENELLKKNNIVLDFLK